MEKLKGPLRKRLWAYFLRLFRWFVPGLGVKRWFVPILLGTTLIGVGLGILILDIYRSAPETWWLPLLSAASLRALSRPLRAIIFGALGGGLVLGGMWGLYRSILAPYRRPGRPVVEELADHRRRDRGPRVVAIGGGHGLSTLLRGLKSYTNNLTAVVSVADDGGSSGRLRRTLGIPPPGDIRNCLAALSNDEALLTQLFQYRFGSGGDGLEGHSFGNLFISAMTDITGGFEDGIAESARVLAVQGKVLPASLHDVRLVADVSLNHASGEVRVEGESSIPKFPGSVRRVWLEPNNPPAYPQAIQAILAAELIIVGPGSLYTSILPNLLVPDLAAAIRASRALKIYVSNVASEPGETEGLTCADYVRILDEHVTGPLFDLVVQNNNFEGTLPEGIQWVKADPEQDADFALYLANLIDRGTPWRHDSAKLAEVLIDLYQERTGPLVE
jgi:uncharacterized cofD-like protein